MLRFLSDIPDYDEELRRLSELENKSISYYLNELLNKLFGYGANEDLVVLLKFIAWVAVIFIIVWVVYKNFLMNDSNNGGTTASGKIDINGLMGTAEDADIRGHNFDSELKKALDDNDFAMAVRLRYLMTLKELDRLSAIKWMEWKTPLIYVEEIEGGEDELKSITLAFLYIKYGHYPATSDTYEEVTAKSESLISAKRGGRE